MKIDLYCPQCDHHVQVVVETVQWEEHGEAVEATSPVEAWCCTAHLRPVRMVEQDPHAQAHRPLCNWCSLPIEGEPRKVGALVACSDRCEQHLG